MRFGPVLVPRIARVARRAAILAVAVPGFKGRLICGIIHPMQRDTAVSVLRAHEAELKRLGVAHLYLFGSTARDEARDDSDIDLFFDYEQGKLRLFQLMDVKERASSILGRRADIMTRDSLHKVLRACIEASAVVVF